MCRKARDTSLAKTKSSPGPVQETAFTKGAEYIESCDVVCEHNPNDAGGKHIPADADEHGMELGFLYHLYVNYVKSYVGHSGRSENVETSSTNMVISEGDPGNPWANLPQSNLESTEHGRVVPKRLQIGD